ncbi:Hypothetical protein R9X50_00405100 [Acrodontium crateriforme]|uniref:Transmembrane protein n=1 Tax=Acrodontium crateriforme TaxID=150365 RepID=A0AAQ3RAF3_9PEZI|nr:Hypothetical protein R9X50_00405100 [Acrodontium crateriforme]
MVRTHTFRAALLACTLASLAQAADASTSSTSTTSSSPDTTSMPPTSDSATSSANPANILPLYNYFFVILAFAICVVGCGFFLYWRRRRIALASMQGGRQHALAEDLNAWDPRGRRRYWHGRMRSAEASREEGLNEEGEAPPPYVPKNADGTTGIGEPAVPLQTLSRDGVGLKPPDYEARYAAQPAVNDSAGTTSRIENRAVGDHETTPVRFG